LVVIAVSAPAGPATLLASFGISLASSQVGGGMLLLTSALNMLNAQPAEAKTSTHELQDGAEKAADGRQHCRGAPDHSIADRPGHHVHRGDLCRQGQNLFPAQHPGGLWRGGGLWPPPCAFHWRSPIARVLGKTGINVMTGSMGLILAALAVEVMSDGLTKLFPVLSGH